MEFQLHIGNVGRKQVFADGLYLANDSLVLLQHIEKFIVIHFKLFFLKQDDPCAFGNGDSLSVKALGLSD